MQRSIFMKYLRITMIIILLSFILLGAIMTVSFSRYWKDEKRDLLTNNAVSMSVTLQNMLSAYGEASYEDDVIKRTLSSFILTFAANMDGDMFVSDSNGKVILGEYPNSGISGIDTVDSDIIKTAMQGFYESSGTFGGRYSSSVYIIGIPVYDPWNSPVGAVFAVTGINTISVFEGVIFKRFLSAIVISFILTLLIVGAFSYRFVNPLRQMAGAAKSFGDGDFSVRVPVNSSDEIGQLAAAFNSMANSLTNSEGTRRSFIANVSHELKTPMTTIAGFIDGILDGTIPECDQKKYLSIVSNEIKRLSRLVKSMLDLSRIDSGEMHITPSEFDVTKLILGTLLTFEKPIEEKHIEIRGLDDIGTQNIEGDQDLLHQVIYNLIENSVKFTNIGGYIKFVVSDGIDRTTVQIENSGPGISPEDLSMVFERFYKTDKSRGLDKNGMGLGLYIVRTIIKLHGGEIAVSSVQNQFCRFEFYIPKKIDVQRLKDRKTIVIDKNKYPETEDNDNDRQI